MLMVFVMTQSIKSCKKNALSWDPNFQSCLGLLWWFLSMDGVGFSPALNFEAHRSRQSIVSLIPSWFECEKFNWHRRDDLFVSLFVSGDWDFDLQFGNVNVSLSPTFGKLSSSSSSSPSTKVLSREFSLDSSSSSSAKRITFRFSDWILASSCVVVMNFSPLLSLKFIVNS